MPLTPTNFDVDQYVYLSFFSGILGFRRDQRRTFTARTSIKMLKQQDPAGWSGGTDGAPLFLGIDFGTSGARYALIDKQGVIRSEGKRAYAPVRVWFPSNFGDMNF